MDGKDICDITQASLRKAIGVVPQGELQEDMPQAEACIYARCLSTEAVLFNESIAYNIGYGKDGATQAEIEEAAKAARIYDRIQTFPDGMCNQAFQLPQFLTASTRLEHDRWGARCALEWWRYVLALVDPRQAS